jgi:hypothetical protein
MALMPQNKSKPLSRSVFLVNFQRGHYIQRSLQNRIVRRRFFRRTAAALLCRFGGFQLGICAG